MDKGKTICQTLKRIRQRIAEENGIEYHPHECNFKGSCQGTCPACEAETRQLEHRLRLRAAAGFPLKLAGIAMSLCTMSATVQAQSTQTGKCRTTQVNGNRQDFSHGTDNAVTLEGRVIYKPDNSPLAGTVITVYDIKGNIIGKSITGIDGTYNIVVPKNATIEFNYVGCETVVAKPEALLIKDTVKMERDDSTLMGEIFTNDQNYDDVYNRKQ